MALNLCSLTVCGFLNMSIVKVGASLCCEEEQALFLARCQRFAAAASSPGARPPQPLRTFRSYWVAKCERDWKLAFTTFTLGALFALQATLASSNPGAAPFHGDFSDPTQSVQGPPARRADEWVQGTR